MQKQMVEQDLFEKSFCTPLWERVSPYRNWAFNSLQYEKNQLTDLKPVTLRISKGIKSQKRNQLYWKNCQRCKCNGSFNMLEEKFIVS